MTDQYEFLLVETFDNGINQITLNRPDKLNALSSELLDELEAVIDTAENNDDIKALLFTGNGKAFCAGADIKRLKDADEKSGLAFAKRGQDLFRKIETLGKPSLAAVNGFAFGGGCELAMATTLRIASNTAQFGQPEVRLGVIPGYGGTQRLARLVGKGRALDLCLTGRFINAETALQWGLVTEVTSPDELIPQAKNILKQITSMAPIAINSVMKCIDLGYDLPLEDALEIESLQFAFTCSTEDKNEGVDAFLNKRPAQFIGQ